MSIIQKIKGARVHLYVGLLVLAMILLFLWPRIVVSIKPGEAGVLYSRFFGGTVQSTVYQEGIHFIVPWNIMYVYDVRLQEYTAQIKVLTKDGLSVEVSSSIRYHPLLDGLPMLHKFVGPEYREKLVYPIFLSSVRETVGAYRPEALYTTARQMIQDQILVASVEEMGRIPIAVDTIIVKRITLPATINQAIEKKLIEEQAFLRYKFILLRTKEEVKRQIMEAMGTRQVQKLVNQGLTENYLRLKGIEATQKLAESANTKMVIVGGKDGLPIILNPDSPAALAPGTGQPTDAKSPAGTTGTPGTQPTASTQPAQKIGTPAMPAPPGDGQAAGKGGMDWKKFWRDLSGINLMLERMIKTEQGPAMERGAESPGPATQRGTDSSKHPNSWEHFGSSDQRLSGQMKPETGQRSAGPAPPVENRQ